MTQLFKGLRLRLLLLGGIPVVLQICMTLLSVNEGMIVEDAVGGIAKRSFPLMEHAYAIDDATTNVIRNTNAALLTWEIPKEREMYLKKISEGLALTNSEGVELEKIEKIPSVESAYQDWKKTLAEFQALSQDLTKKMADPSLTKPQLAELTENYLHGSAAAVREQLDTHGDKVKELILAVAHTRTSVGMSAAHNNNLIVTLGGLAVFLVSTVLIILTTRGVTKSMDTTQEMLNSSGEQVQAASEQLSGASQMLSSGSSQSAASLEESVASMAELSSMVKMNSENAQQAASLSQKGSQEAVAGSEAMSQLMTNMNEINESSAKVRDIVSVIDDIAFQTNLLALNASVEAARAGEQGKGFAVVADAVRTLAQKSASSAKEIEGLIKQSGSQVQKGVATAERSFQVLQQLTDSIRKIADLNQEISTASTEQSKGLEQISAAFNQLDQGVQSNASTSEEVAASAEELSAQAKVMRQAIDELDHFVNGAPAQTVVSPSPELKRPQLSVVKKAGTRAKPKAQFVVKKSASKVAATASATNMGSLPTTDDDFWNEMPRIKRQG